MLESGHDGSRRRILKSIRSDIVANFLMSLINSIGMMAMLWAASNILPAVALGTFLLIRRVADTVSQAMHLGAPASLRRYLSITADSYARAEYFRSCLLLAAIGIGLGSMIFLVAPDWASSGVLGAESRANSILTILFSAALVIQYLGSSSLLGMGRFITNNVLELVTTALAPMLMLMFIRNVSVVQILALQAAVISVAYSVVLSVCALHLRGSGPRADRAGEAVKFTEVFQYGVPRAATLFLETAFVVIGPWYLRHDLAEAGFFALAFFTLRIARTAIQPVTMVAAMGFGRLISQGSDHQVKRGLNILVGATGSVAMLGAAIVVPWTGRLLEIWLGPIVAPSVAPYAEVLMIAMIPLCIFYAIREPIEIMWKTPFTFVVFSVGSSVLVFSILVLRNAFGEGMVIGWSYVIAYTVMTSMALWTVRRELHGISYFGLVRLTAVSLILFSINMIASRSVLADAPRWLEFCLMAVALGLSAAVAAMSMLIWKPSRLAVDLKAQLTFRKAK